MNDRPMKSSPSNKVYVNNCRYSTNDKAVVQSN